MSEHFWRFTITCPYCGHKARNADGFETDDWVEVFAFSGYSAKSARHTYNPYYRCPVCDGQTDRDQLYRERRIEPDSIDRVKQYLKRMLAYVVEHRGIYDHGWDPDLMTAIERYAALEPDNREWIDIKLDYYRALNDRRWYTKFEPSKGTLEITRQDIHYHKLLDKVYLPSGLKKIADNTFQGCSKLDDIFVPDSVEFIGESAFEDAGLKKIHLSKNLKRINNYTFKGCYGLTKIFLSDDIKIIGTGAFEGCRGLNNQWLPSALERIEDYAFKGCTKLEKLKVPESVEYIGEHAFEGCPDLVLVVRHGSYGERYAQSHELPYVYEDENS